MKGHWTITGAALAVVFCVGSASAETSLARAPSDATHLRYEAWWGGLYAAEFTLTLSDGGSEYETVFSLGTRGLLDWLIGLDLEATSTGETRDGLTPEAYRSKYRSNSREGTTTIAFDPDTGEATVSRNVVFFEPRDPETDDPARPQVPAELRTGVLDPLSAFAEAIDRLRRHGDPEAVEPFTVAIFDGKRRFDMSGEMLGLMRHEASVGGDIDVERRVVPKHPGAFAKPGQRSGRQTQLVSVGGAALDFVPLQIIARGWGPAINLVEECARPCALTPRE